jgi:GT2 family glycosyltransferase
MEVSVIIVSYNVREYLRQCLISVLESAESVECEIFVVDNNSTDGSADMVRNEFPGVKIIANKENSGFSSANNQAIKKSNGKYILLLNPDTIIEADTISKCIGFMNDHSDAGILGVKMVNREGRFLPESKRAFPEPLTAFFKVFGLSFIFPRSHFFNRYYLTNIGTDETAPAEAISGAFMFIRMEALIKAGLLDEDFFMYGEDIDLSYRISRKGYTNYYFPEVCIIHFKGMSTPVNKYTDIKYFYDAMRIYAGKRNRERVNPLYFLIIPAIIFRQGIALAVRFIRITFLRQKNNLKIRLFVSFL